jgi:Domain of unknown function (DUF4389)
VQDLVTYPVRFEPTYPDSLNRLLNLPFFIGTVIKLILCIPFLIFLAIFLPGGLGGGGGGGQGTEFIAIVSGLLALLWLIGPVWILFTGQYPRGLWGFLVGVQRVQARVHGYAASLNDKYPPFALRPVDEDQVTFEIDYPPSFNRLLNFPILGQIVKLILCIPHLVVVFFLSIAAIVLVFVGQFAILFTGNMPEGMWNFIAGTLQWQYRVFAYIFAFTDRYPPFSLSIGS